MEPPVSTPAPSKWAHRWSETWRMGMAAFCGFVMLAGVASTDQPGYINGAGWTFGDAAFGLIAVCLLHYRRRWPLAVALVTIVMTSIAISVVPAAAIAFISLSTHRRVGQIVWASAAWLTTAVAYELIHTTKDPSTGDYVSSALLTILSAAFCIAVGQAIGSRRELVRSLQQQVESAREQERSRLQQARLGERSRIAREMHDVLAHRISLVAMHSGALAYRSGLTEDEVKEASTIIRDNAELALAELREVLGVLRDNESSGIEPPQPNLGAVPALVAETPTADGQIDLTVDGDLLDVPESLSRSGFRIVQEALTNRRKHSFGMPIKVRISRTAQALRIQAVNDTNGTDHNLPESGLGLLGLAERVSLAGGELTYGVDRADHFVLDATLPLNREDETANERVGA